MPEGIYKQEGKRGVTYRAVVSAGTDPVTGRRRQLVRTFRSEREAIDWRLETLQRIRAGTYSEPSTVPLGEYLTRWLASRQDLAPSSRKRYEGVLRLHIIPNLGHVPLGELRPDHVQDLYDRLAGTSVPFMMHAILHPALDRARRLGMIHRDILDGGDRHRSAQHPHGRPAAPMVGLGRVGAVSGHRPRAGAALLPHLPLRGSHRPTAWRGLATALGGCRPCRWGGARHTLENASRPAAGGRSIRIRWPCSVSTGGGRCSGGSCWGVAWSDEGLVFDRGDGAPWNHRTIARAMDRNHSARRAATNDAA